MNDQPSNRGAFNYNFHEKLYFYEYLKNEKSVEIKGVPTLESKEAKNKLQNGDPANGDGYVSYLY